MAGLGKKVMSGAAISLLGLVFSTLATLWATPKLYHGLTPELFGVLGLLVGMQGAVIMVLGQGVQNVILILLARDQPEPMRRHSRGLSAVAVISAGLALALGWVCAIPAMGLWLFADPGLAAEWTAAAPWAGLAWALQLLLMAYWSAARARLRYQPVEYQRALFTLLAVLAGPWALWRGGSLTQVVQAQALVWLLGLGLALFLERLQEKPLALWPQDAREVFKEAYHIVAWGLVSSAGWSILSYGDRLLSLQSGARELGNYSVATSLSLRLAGLFGLLGPLLLPALSAVQKDGAKSSQMRSLYFRGVGLGAAALFLGFAVLGGPLMGAWVGPELEQSSLRWVLPLSMGGFALCLSAVADAVLLAQGLAKATAYCALAAAVIGLACGWLAQSRGLSGAAWMGATGHGAMLVLRLFVLWKHDRQAPLQRLLVLIPSFLALSFVGLALAALPWSQWLPASIWIRGAAMGAVMAAFLALFLGVDAGLAGRRHSLSVWGQVWRRPAA